MLVPIGTASEKSPLTPFSLRLTARSSRRACQICPLPRSVTVTVAPRMSSRRNKPSGASRSRAPASLLDRLRTEIGRSRTVGTDPRGDRPVHLAHQVHPRAFDNHLRRREPAAQQRAEREVVAISGKLANGSPSGSDTLTFTARKSS